MINWSEINIAELKRGLHVDYPCSKIRIGNKIIDVVHDWEAYYKFHLEKRTPLRFNGVIFLHTIDFDKEYEYIYFDDCYFNDNVFINGVFNERVYIRNCVFNQILAFLNPIFKSDLTIDECFIHRIIEIDNGVFNGVFILNVKGHFEHGGGATINTYGGDFKNFTIGYNSEFNTEIKNVTFATGRISGNIYIVNNRTTIENIYLNHASNNLVIVFEDFYVNNLSVGSFTNSNRFKINNIKSLKLDGRDSEFKIHKSNLGKTEFLNVDLSKFDTVNIVDSNITDCLFVNTIWPDSGITSFELNGSKIIKPQVRAFHKRWYKKPTETEVNYYFKNRETYRQLKYAQGRQGDIVMEQYFHGKEMSSYIQYLNLFSRDFGIITITFLSWITSDFGQSIFRPIMTLFATHLLLFLLSIYFGALCPFYYSDIGDWIYHFFYLMNPIHIYEFKKNGTIILDVLMRVLSSYMIYNFIRASRRFIK